METRFPFAKRVFLIAAIYGFTVLVPQYFLEASLVPPTTHPEQFYGFIGIALAWQFVFVMIARDVARYRPLMPIAVVEKLAFGLPALILYLQGRVSVPVLVVGLIDLLLGALFAVAFFAVKQGGVNMKPTYFDLTVHDVGQARRFFEAVFGWQFERFPMPYEYYRIQAGPAGEPGIDGGIGAVKDAPIAGGMPAAQLTVPVADLDAAVAKVQASGGSVVEPRMPIPGIGWYATCAEPGGLRFGMIQADPAAK